MIEAKAVETPTRRVVHVPLTQPQWVALKVEAAQSEQTIGEVVARALTQSIPTVGRATA